MSQMVDLGSPPFEHKDLVTPKTFINHHLEFHRHVTKIIGIMELDMNSQTSFGNLVE